MPFDPREFSESLRLETVITSAEIELENSLVYALYSKAQASDDAKMRDQLLFSVSECCCLVCSFFVMLDGLLVII